MSQVYATECIFLPLIFAYSYTEKNKAEGMSHWSNVWQKGHCFCISLANDAYRQGRRKNAKRLKLGFLMQIF